MPLSAIPFDDIDEGALLQLKDNGVPEGREVDYKRDAIGNSDKDKKEFLKDVSAFANAAGGHLVIGMEERRGVPTALTGIAVPDIDAEMQRLDSMIRDSLEPRLIGLQLRAVPLASGSHAVVIRVPRSWNPPHRVTFKGWNKFFTRNSNGSHEVNVEELRALFTLSRDLEERVRLFRIERIAKIKANETPFPVESNAWLVLHVVPLTTIGRTGTVDVRKAYEKGEKFRPIRSNGFNRRANFDGLVVTFGDVDQHSNNSNTQVFRDGCVETVSGGYIMERQGGMLVPWADLDKDMFEVLPGYVSGLADLGIGPPYAVMVSMLGFRGAKVAVDSWGKRGVLSDRDDILVPSVTIQVNELSGDWHHLVKPIFDAIFNSFGELGALNFDAEGKWAPKVY
jgi:hypothetical protein